MCLEAPFSNKESENTTVKNHSKYIKNLGEVQFFFGNFFENHLKADIKSRHLTYP